MSFLPDKLFGSDKSGELWADRKAAKLAEARHQKRSRALEAFKAVLAEGAKQQEDWAIDGNFEEALNRLTEEDRNFLTRDIPGRRIHEILTIEDDKQRAEALFEFAVGERPGFLGYGGGNATGFSTANIFNYTGRHHNLYFARSVLRRLAMMNISDDPHYNGLMREIAISEYRDMVGDGGGFSNLLAAGLSNIFCLGGNLCETAKFRAWGDEGKMDALGQAMEFGLIFYGSFKFAQFGGEAAAFNASKASVWSSARKHFSLRPRWLGGKGFQPFPIAALRAERRAQLPIIGVKNGKPVSAFDLIGNMMNGGAIGFASTVSFIRAQAKAKTEFNPFEANHQLELAPYPDLTQSPTEK